MENLIRKIVKEELQNYVPTFSNMNVPPHVHNGSDSQQIPFKNISVLPGDGGTPTIDNGIPLINGKDMYSIYLLDSGGIAPLVIQPNEHAFDGGGANLYFGLSNPFSGTVFNRIFMNVDGAVNAEEITLTATDTVGGGTNASDLSVLAGAVNADSTDGTDSSSESLLPRLKLYTATGDFAIQLPTSTAPTPVKGMYYFDGINFQGVDGSGTFQYIPTSDGTTTSGTVAIGTVELTINGTPYNVLVA